MNRSFQVSAALFAFVAVAVAACGGGGDGGGGGGNGGGGDNPVTTPGKETYTPPTNSTPGGGKPEHATSVTCSTADDCGYWYCRCQDGAIVNSANCTNGYCLDQTVACPNGCSAFKHGTWTGDYGGGPSTQSTSSSSSSGGSGGDQCGTTDTTCGLCLRQSCCAESLACYKSSACQSYLDCIATCAGDTDCLFACESANPDGASNGTALEDCGKANCPSECVW
jgi:hypothetical protein